MTTLEAPSAPLVITLFGSLQVLADGHPLPRLRSRKGIWIVALLALRHDRPVEREWLAGVFWPDMEPSQAFANLRPILSELRSGLGSQKERLQSPDRHTLRLDLTDTTVDVLTFDAAIERGRPSDLERAVVLYRGPLLEGCTEEWVFQERNAREHQCLQALDELGNSALMVGDYGKAIGYYRRMVDIDPLSESARRGWMEALARSGDTNAALQVYREFVESLRSDPKASPDEQTTALYQRLRPQIRQRGSAPTVVVKTEAAAVPKVAGYLPHPLTDLVGREDALLEVAARLRRSRLVTLTGLGGIGKTRLAIEVAGEVVPEYADGVWLVALEALSDGKLVAQQIASVLGLKEVSGQTLLQSVTNHLRTKRLLLVLDNCEHLLEASAQIIASLLRECIGVRILATSREALGITGETVWTVPSLTTPDTAHLPQASATLLRVLMGYESVQLFVERAQAVQKSFVLTREHALAVAQICFQLEGIPLAIELAAARVKAMTVEQIAQRLDDYLSLLTGGSRTAMSRQQTLRATLDWSYALLSEMERLLLRRLSVFTGGWTLDAAEAVCAENGLESWQVLDLLTSLVDRSLVAYEEREPEAGGRYRLLEMVRQYAAERLKASGEAATIGGKHSRWFLALAQEAERHLTQADQGFWLRRLEREHSNLRATLDRCGTEDAETGLQIAIALVRFWYLRGHLSEGRKYLEQALGREETQGVTARRAKALNGAGVLAYRQGDYAAARTLYEESLRIRKELGDRRGVAESLNNLANVAHHQGDYETVKTSYQETLQIFTELRDKRNMAWSLNGLGTATETLGDYASAQALHEESLRICRELGDKRGIAVSLNSLGNNILMREGDYPSVRALFEESLSLSKEIGDTYGIGLSLYRLSDLLLIQGDYTTAQVVLEENLSLCRQSGDRYTLAWIFNCLGRSARLQSNTTSAHAHYEESLRLFQELGDRHGIAWSLCGLGYLTTAQDDQAQSQSLFRESLRIFRNLSNREGMEENLRALAQILATQKELQKAVRLWSAAQTLRQSLSRPLRGEEHETHDQLLRQARLVLGEEAFAAAWAEGGAMTWEQSVVFALSDEV
ncbi:MAG: hypothetical protein JWL77_4320 [Chthonomonadaceae bacterium]|nr:hypothetical protein [Chthonomonadaceae bacterium]